MRFLPRNVALLAVVVCLLAAWQQPGRAGQAGARGAAVPAAPPPLMLTSTGFPDAGIIPEKYTAAYATPDGDRVSPPLSWKNAPANTQSFVLHMHDLDSAIDHTTDDSLHWLMWNIPGSANGLPERVRQGIQREDGSYQVSSTTQFDQRGKGYRAPAGGNGPLYHHYAFDLFALDTKLDVRPAADPFETRRNVIKAMQGHILGKAVYLGLFHLPPGVNPSVLK